MWGIFAVTACRINSDLRLQAAQLASLLTGAAVAFAWTWTTSHHADQPAAEKEPARDVIAIV